MTDRIDLQEQLSKTATLSGETVHIAGTTDELKERLGDEGPGLLFATIQKAQEHERQVQFPELNTSEDILLLIDEAHRSNTSDLHANLMRALPNCAKIGFTGTPILMGEKKRTHEIFGSYVDTYTIEQAVKDGVIVKILYEGRMERAAIKDGRTLDQLFDDAFADRSEEEREEIKKKHATKRQVLQAEPLIQAKARDMVRHYVGHVLPNGMKAQVAATSRRAAVRYQSAISTAVDELIEEVEDLDPALLGLSPKERKELRETDPDAAFRATAHAHLDTLRRIGAAAVISGNKKDPDSWKQWTGSAASTQHINAFKKPLAHQDPEKADGLAFLCVCTKLLTGFDAPVEQVIYLDRQLKEHNLLQAIARVNRLYTDKEHGLVVDYYNVAHHLEEALDVYSDDDVKGALVDIEEELPRLRSRFDRIIGFLAKHDITDLWEQEEEAVQFLEDPKHRATFTVHYKDLSASMETVMPRPEALKYQDEVAQLGKIKKRASNRYRDEALVHIDAGAKVRELIDEHLTAEGIAPKVPPVDLLDATFSEHIEQQPSTRAKASEMEHAVRHHIRTHRDEDPAFYDSLSERLEKILSEYENEWKEKLALLKQLQRQVQEGREADDTGLSAETEAPFFSLLEQVATKEVRSEVQEADEPYNTGNETLPDEERKALADATVDMVEHIQQEVRIVDFWRNDAAQKDLCAWVFRHLAREAGFPYEKLDATADRVMDLARHRHATLAK